MKIVSDLKELSITRNTKILGIFPHPDDETAFCAGFLHKAGKIGADIVVVTMTNGDKSTLRHGLDINDSLAKIRRAELLRAMGLLGITELLLGHFPDGEVGKHKAKIKKFLTKILASFSPDFVVTLEPDGVYGHPDHIATSAIVTSLIKTKQLMYATVDKHFAPSAGAAAMARKKIHPISPNVRVRLTADETEMKLHAFRSHKSQFIVDEAFIAKWHKNNLLKNEFFYIM